MHLRPQLLLLVIFGVIATPAIAQGTPPATPVGRMAADAHPSFAVAVIRPHDPNSRRQGFNNDGNRITIRNESLASMISFAYAVHARQLVDAPDWVFHDRYDIQGKADAEGEPSLKQQQEMLQKLLGDRFQLHFRREKRELSVFAIQVAKGGAKLKPAANPDAEPDQQGNGHGTESTLTFTSFSLADLAMGMQFFLDRPAVDETGLAGRYDFAIHYTWDEASTTDPNAPPGIFTAIQEQLGLKLQPVKAPVDVFVIDHVERPSEN